MDARQAAYLRQLGVDVWVPRRRTQDGPPAAAPSPPVAETAPPKRVEAPAVAQRHAPRAAASAETAFTIRCFHYGRVFVALAEDAWPWRRFLLDVARAMNGFNVAERQDLVFDWPQPGADPSGGGRAFRAFLGHQTRNGERSLMSGQRVLDLVGGMDAVDEIDGRIYVPPGAPDADTKKRLWDRIRKL